MESTTKAELIEYLEEHYDGKYVGDWAIKNTDGIWTDEPIIVLYIETPSRPEYSNYAGFFFRGKNLMVCDAAPIFNKPMRALLEDGVFYVSKFRHDYVTTPKGGVIDGGRDYCRTRLTEEAALVNVMMYKGELKQVFNIEGVPVDYEPVRFGKIKQGEYYLNKKGEVCYCRRDLNEYRLVVRALTICDEASEGYDGYTSVIIDKYNSTDSDTPTVRV